MQLKVKNNELVFCMKNKAMLIRASAVYHRSNGFVVVQVQGDADVPNEQAAVDSSQYYDTAVTGDDTHLLVLLGFFWFPWEHIRLF